MSKHTINVGTIKYIFDLIILKHMIDNFEELLYEIQNYKSHPSINGADLVIELLLSKIVMITEMNNKLIQEKIHINQIKISILKADLEANKWREDGYLVWHN
jgi:hypothetical protein